MTPLVAEGAVAVVTGASSGIGEAIARRLAERKATVVITARSEDRLKSLAAEWSAAYGTRVVPVALDLSQRDGPEMLFAATEGAGLTVDLLVNNAGFGLLDAEVDLPLPRVLELVDLNVRATTELTHRYLVAMRGRRRGSVLNVASTAAFIPGPYFAAYSASKSYILSFSQALHEEAKEYGVLVTCLCPGFTDTNFDAVAGVQRPKGMPFPTMTPDQVAVIGLTALEKRKSVVITAALDKVWINAGRLLPRTVPPKIAEVLFRKSKKRT